MSDPQQTKSPKQRLDAAVYERGLAPSREKARGMVMAQEVFVNGKIIDKPGARVKPNDDITLKSKPRFVSRGGEKLAGALGDFRFDPSGKICADVGASTGGFTDCLLQNGATKVYSIDVGYGQLDYTLRQDERVVVMERTNARYVESLSEQVDMVVVDASFISLQLLIPAFKHWLRPQADVIALIKPQFEAGKQDVGKGGVIRDPDIHRRVLESTLVFVQLQGFDIRGLTMSPLKGPAGNTEFLVWFSQGQAAASFDMIHRINELITG